MMQLTVDNSALGVSLTGWNLAITSTQFSTGANALASSASTMTGASATCSGVCTSPPVSSVPYPVAVPAGPGPPAAVKFFNAATATGVGTFTITPTINVAVPANTFAGTYSTTLTLAIASGP